MNFWESLVKNMRSKKGHFNGTEDTAAIQKRIDSGKSFDISNPTSYRTYQNVGKGSLDPNDIETGLTSGTAGAISSTAIKNIQFDPSTENAKVTFTSSNKQYDYPMTVDEFKSFMNSDSKGRWINKEARKYY